MSEHIRNQSSSSGTGKPTVLVLRRFLETVPDEAVITLHSVNEGRDGPTWSIKAAWDEDRDVLPHGTLVTNVHGPDTHRSVNPAFRAYQEGIH